jgi:hypothetical protein
MLANLRALFSVVIDIILLRRGPENLPASTLLLALVIALNFLLYGILYYTLVMPNDPRTSGSWPLQLVIGALVTMFWFRLALKLSHRSERFVQTMIAVFATNTLFLPAALPIIGALIPYSEKPGSPVPATLALPALLIAIWILAVQARIVRSAFDWSWTGSIGFVVGNNISAAILLSILFGDSQRTA